MVSVVEVLLVIQYSVLVVRSGYTRSGGIKGSKSKVMKSLICRGWVNPVTGIGRTSVDIGASANLELVDQFCYLGDMLSVDGDANAAVARIWTGWNKFRQYGYTDVSLIMKGRQYNSCV